jgi:hypothetical protein
VNLVLLAADDLVPGLAAGPQIAVLKDRRLAHLRAVLRVAVGDTL